MTLNIITTSESDFRYFGPGTSAVSISGSNIIGVGVQTDNFQTHFSIVQAFVHNNGSNAFIQVANNKVTGDIGWRCFITYAVDSADIHNAALSIEVVESQPMVEEALT